MMVEDRPISVLVPCVVSALPPVHGTTISVSSRAVANTSDPGYADVCLVG